MYRQLLQSGSIFRTVTDLCYPIRLLMEFCETNVIGWHKRQMLSFGVPYDFVYLMKADYSIPQLVQKIIPSLLTVYYLSQKDFDNGPLIIRKSGTYRLETDIIFSPFQNNCGKPTKKWLKGLPAEERDAYVLGIFAGIVIKADNVCLDLNGRTFKTSELFFIQQTFYSHVELASTPFISGQGPANFGEDVLEANQVSITNGTFGLSAHHGIHGNLCKNCIFSDLKFENFAVAAIHLNGSHNVVLNNIVADNKNVDIKINSLFSQAQFMLELLRASNLPIESDIVIKGETQTLDSIKKSLERHIVEVVDSVKGGKPYSADGIFFNKSGKLDANVYGVVLNTKGIAVGDFKDVRENSAYSDGNSNIVLNNICIKNVQSDGSEVCVLSDKVTSKPFVGPAGDVFDYTKASNENGSYKSNCLADAQLFAAKHSLNNRVYIPKPIMEWAANGETDIEDVISENNYYILSNRDSMNHVMKGNIGLFIQQAYRLVAESVTVENITNTSSSCSTDAPNSYGILLSGCENISLKKYNISNVKSKKRSREKLIEFKNTNKDISLI